MAFTIQGAVLLLIIFSVMLVYVAKPGDSWDSFIFSLKALGLLISVIAFFAAIIAVLYFSIMPNHPKL